MNAEQRQIVPKCPHCEVQPCMIGMLVISMGMGTFVGEFVCASCEKILGVFPVPRPAHVSPDVPQPSLIVRGS